MSVFKVRSARRCQHIGVAQMERRLNVVRGAVSAAALSAENVGVLQQAKNRCFTCGMVDT